MTRSSRPLPAWPSVDVWWIDLTRQADVGVLSDEELCRAATFARPDLARRFMARRAARRVILSRYAGIAPPALAFRTARNGKPELAGTALQFSASASADCAVIAVAARGIGVDVERRRPLPDLPALVRQICSVAETTMLDALAEPARTERFFRFWTAKEAAVKLTGDGLSADLRAAGGGDGVIRLDAPEGFEAALAGTVRPRPVAQHFEG